MKSGRKQRQRQSQSQSQSQRTEEEEEYQQEEEAEEEEEEVAAAAEDAAKFADATNKDGLNPRSSAYNEEETRGGCVLGGGQRAIERTRGASERASAPDQSPRERGKGLKTGGWQDGWWKAAQSEGSGPVGVRLVEG